MQKQIKVSEKALGHLSRGLYRSPASALRELVSNAWDANAKVVRIDTNYPYFQQVSIEDDGDGFTRDEFDSLMSGGIGNSDKRSGDRVLINDRPIIGRLGIGMLGIAQIGGSFSITSKTKDGSAFRARVILYDLIREKLDEEDEEVVIKEGRSLRTKHVDIGTYEFDDDFDPETTEIGTTIIADDVSPTFAESFRESIEHEQFKEISRSWKDNLKVMSSVRSVQELGEYWRLLWELSTSCPVPYLDEDALPDQLVLDDQRRLKSYDFTVLVDGIKLLKPVSLEGHDRGYTTEALRYEKQVFGRELAFHGYIVVQEGAQLKPEELRGLLIRINNIGIGYYDPSLLNYRINEGPRSRWLTGEIYTEEGLEDALNIDRDSFNKFHPAYQALQKYVHKILQERVFKEVYKQIEVRSKEKAKSRLEARKKYLEDIITQEVGSPAKVEYAKEGQKAAGIPAVGLSKQSDGSVKVRLPDPTEMRTKKANQQLASAILAIYEVAANEEGEEKQREVFAKQLLGLLSKW